MSCLPIYLYTYLFIYLHVFVKEWFIVDVHFFPWDCRYDGFKNTMTPTLLQKCHFNKINDIAFPNNYSDLFATASTNDIRLWNLKEMKELLRIEVHFALGLVASCYTNNHLLIQLESWLGVNCFAYIIFHVLVSLWCMLGVVVEDWTKDILYWCIKSQFDIDISNLRCLNMDTSTL